MGCGHIHGARGSYPVACDPVRTSMELRFASNRRHFEWRHANRSVETKGASLGMSEPRTLKSPRNKTIDFAVQCDNEYLLRCITPEAFASSPHALDVTVWGDAFEALKSIPRASIDLLVVDPPYNRTKTYGSTRFRARTQADYETFTRRWLDAVLPSLKDDASVYVCSDWQSSLILGPILDSVFTVRNRITWQREKGRGAKVNWKNSHEDVWFCTMSDDYLFNLDEVKQRRRVIAPYRVAGTPKDWEDTPSGRFRDTHPSNFWDDITVPFWSMPENTAHPTQKPEKLLAKMILASTEPGDVVLDPFAGSGTTSVVAKKLGRRYIGIENEADYCAWAEFRLAEVAHNREIQGYSGGVFWERNTLQSQNRGGASG